MRYAESIINSFCRIMKIVVIFIYKAFCALIRLLFWHFERLIPRNQNKWIFGSWFGEKYSDNSRALYEYVLKEMPYIKPMWLTSNDIVYKRLKKEGKPVALLSSIKGKLFALTAKFAFITVERKEVNGYYLNGAKLIWLYHGMLMKYVMADERRFIEGASYDKMTSKKIVSAILFPYKSVRNYNVGRILVTSDFFSPFFESAFRIDSTKIWVDGYPRNDDFFSDQTEEIILKYRALYPSAKFIIHMPTHRLHGLNGEPFNPFDGYGFSTENFYDTLEKGDYVYFYKGHFYDSNNRIELNNDRFVRVTDEDFDSLYRMIKDMDLLITDYSSIYFDYLLLKRPIILTPFDYDEYITNERPLYYDYKKNLIANYVSNWDELLDLLLNKTFILPNLDLVNKYHRNVDGNSCRRISDHIINWV